MEVDTAPTEIETPATEDVQQAAMDSSAEQSKTEPETKAADDKETTETEGMDVDNTEEAQKQTDDTKQDSPTKDQGDKSKESVPVMPKQGGNFSLGVPGLSFSSSNVKTANDGTKMVQIHQSQITPEQLVALQSNPNIKVVFRHIPSGKSYSKPPRHLLPPGYKSPAKKRKARLADGAVPSDPGATDVYSFDEGEDFGAPAKMLKSENRARYNYGSAMKKKGRPRVIPDSTAFASSFLKVNKQQSMPAKVILTDLLARINNPKAVKEVKLHTSQINAEVLANMELNPRFKIVLTSKQELPPLVIEDVTKEEEEAEEEAKESVDKETKEEEKKVEFEEEEKVETPEQTEEEKEEENDEDEEEKKRIADEKEAERKEKEEARQQRIKEEEEELAKSVQNQRSRSGRIRKPSRFSLDIARLTKRKSLAAGGDSSTDEAEQETKSKPSTPASTKSSAKKSKVPEREPTPPPADTPKTRKRGRPRRSAPAKAETEDPVDKDKETNEKEDEKSPEEKVEEEQKSDKDDKKTTEKKSEDKPTEEEKSEEKEDVEKEQSVADEKKDSSVPEKKVEEETKKVEEETESEKEVTSTENEPSSTKDAEKAVEEEEVKAATVEDTEKPTGDVVAAEPDTSTDATKDSKDEKEKPADSEAMDTGELFSLEIDEKEDVKEEINNKFRLRKLLEQCSADEIKSVFLPEALDAINFGDFLLYKSGQMHKESKTVSFPEIYEQFESLHKSTVKEATRYNTLVKRANKVGGDKRMEKIVLMPVYHRNAADSLEISSMSIDAHICGIQKPMTTQMIAANSFFIKAKMDSPVLRLRLPEATAPKHVRPKNRRPLYTNHHQQKFLVNQRQPEPDSTTSDQPKTHKRATFATKYSAMMSNRQSGTTSDFHVRKPTYLQQARNGGQVENHFTPISSQDNALQSIPVDSSALLKTGAQNVQMTSALAQLQATVDLHQQTLVTTTNSVTDSLTATATPAVDQLVAGQTTFVTTSATNSDTTSQSEQYFISDEGVAVANDSADGDPKRHLVPIGDGQYVELPEGYSLIQTEEGFIIGQPGSTFTQGEDGDVYVTNSDGTTSKITQETEATEEAAEVLEPIAQG